MVSFVFGPRLVVVVVVVAMVGLASGDMNNCSDVLPGLFPCLDYATGEAKAPTKECCTGLNGVIVKSSVCLCKLIKESKSSQFNINATLAATLPSLCSVPSNYSLEMCIDLLGLNPNSTDAATFRALAGSTKKAGNSTPAAAAAAAPATAATATASTSGPSSNGKNETATPSKKNGAEGCRVGMRQVCIQAIVGAVMWILQLHS